MKIIEVSKTNLSFPFEFNGPSVDISREKTICVQAIYLELNKPIRTCLVDLRSTLVDKSAANPSQIICSYYQQYSQSGIYYTPTTFLAYKIQSFSLNDSVFKFHFSKEVGDLKITRVRITLSFDGDK